MSDNFISLVHTLHKSVCGSAPVSSHIVCVLVLGLIPMIEVRGGVQRRSLVFIYYMCVFV